MLHLRCFPRSLRTLPDPTPSHLRRVQALTTARAQAARPARSAVLARAAPPMEALIFDCDGVIVESEELHRLAYNAAFAQFDVRETEGDAGPIEWSVQYYNELSNTVGGGIAKMRWHFAGSHPAAINGVERTSAFEGGAWPGHWPRFGVQLGGATAKDSEELDKCIAEIQDWKSKHYQTLVVDPNTKPRPGVLALFDAARAKGLKVAVASAANKQSCIATVNALLTPERVNSLDVFLAGDDVSAKKPDPMIYNLCADRLGVDPAACVVVEDSSVGCDAATRAGMRCLITYTYSSKDEPFAEAFRVVENLEEVTIDQLIMGQTGDERKK